MKKGSRNRKKERRDSKRPGCSPSRLRYLESCYEQGRSLAEKSDYIGARLVLKKLIGEQLPPRLGSLVHNDMGTLDFLEGELAKARGRFERALSCDPNYRTARQNLELLERYEQPASPKNTDGASLVPPPLRKVRVAIISELFNWPSTGGGTVHTAETGKFLSRAGYDVKHFYAQYSGWGVGNVTEPLEHPAEAMVFEPAEWNLPQLQRRFREAVDRFAPDYVIITDSWNLKPQLAQAMRGYKYFLRLAAQECLCPLNNVRLLVDDEGHFSACPRNQLATAAACRQCVAQNQHRSGSLHQAERALSGYGTAEYDRQLREAFSEAEGVLAVNPLIAATVSPFAKSVHVVPSGFDPERFPCSWPEEHFAPPKSKTTVFFAGLVNECMKGFHILHAACTKLWKKRQDFELVVTSDPPNSEWTGQADMIRFIGWQSQADLPKQLRMADFLVFPTVAEEALGRSAVEAMGAGKAVIASRIGGLPFTVTEGLTGLLFEPGNVDELASKIEVLLDDPALRERMGAAGRDRFVKDFTWDAIIDAHYRKLLKPIEPKPAPSATEYNMERREGPALENDSSLRPPAQQQPFLDEVTAFLGMDNGEVGRMFATYCSMHDRQAQAAGPKDSPALTLEEGFLICMLLSITRPSTIVVAGSDSVIPERGRRFHDLRSLVGLECQVVHYDGKESSPVDGDGGTDAMEPSFNESAITDDRTPKPMPSGSFDGDILGRYGSGLIWISKVTSKSSKEIIAATARHYGQWILVTGGSSGRRDEYGNAAIRLGLEGMGFSGTLTDQANATHRLKEFSAARGMTLLIPRSLAAAPPGPK